MQEMIKRYFPEEVETTNPEGGMFLWVTLPEGMNAERLAQKCLNNGVAVVPGKSFYTDETSSSNLRMNFSNSPIETIEEGIKKMGQLIKLEATKGMSILN